MSLLPSDLRYALRTLGKQPSLTLVAVLTLGLGIGANTVIFSVVDSVLLKPLPYPDPERLVLLNERHVESGPVPVGWMNFLDWRAEARSFEKMAAYKTDGVILTGFDEPRRLPCAHVSASFFELTGARPALGRFYSEAEDAPGAERVAVLDYAFWRERFSGDAGVLGRSVQLDGRPYVIVGVTPEGFRYFSRRVEVYLPIGLSGDQPAWLNRGNHQGLRALARLREDSGLDSARAEMETLALALEAKYPDTNSGERVTIQPLLESQVEHTRPSLIMLLACVGLVLLITCANVANLLLARGISRTREIAVRAALGAGRWRIARLLIIESLVLAVTGGALGLVIASWGIDPLLQMAPAGIPRLDLAHVDGSVLAFTFAVSVLTGLLFGAAPAFHATRTDLTQALKDGSRTDTSGPASRRIQSALLVAEVAIALVVVIGAGLMARSIAQVHRVDPGLKPERVLALDVILPSSKYQNDESRSSFFRAAVERIGELPGVESAGGVACLPLNGSCWSSVYIVEGLPVPEQAQLPTSSFNLITPGYFSTMGIPLIEGRLFNADDGAASPEVIIVNESMAKRWWPGGSALGHRVKQGFPQDKTPWREIVGVVADTRQMGPEQPADTEVFLPFDQMADTALSLVVLSSAPPATLAPAVRREIARLDAAQPVDNVRTMEEYLSLTMARRRFSTLLLGLFAGLALLLSAVGIYSVVSCGVSMRTREFGVRMALGAARGDVLRLVLVQGARLALVGVGAGLAGALALTRLMAGLLYGVGPTDPITFASLAALLAVVAVASCSVPAWRATRVDPMVALRHE